MKRVNKKKDFNRREILRRLEWQKDGVYSLEIKKYWSKTEAQQWYYWGVVIQTIALETWYNGVQWFNIWWTPLIMDWKEYIHWIIKGLLHKQTSKDMNKFEYSELIETWIMLAEHLGIKIPEPQT